MIWHGTSTSTYQPEWGTLESEQHGLRLPHRRPRRPRKRPRRHRPPRPPPTPTPNTHSHADGDCHSDPNTDAYSLGHFDRDCYGYAFANGHADRDRHANQHRYCFANDDCYAYANAAAQALPAAALALTHLRQQGLGGPVGLSPRRCTMLSKRAAILLSLLLAFTLLLPGGKLSSSGAETEGRGQSRVHRECGPARPRRPHRVCRASELPDRTQRAWSSRNGRCDVDTQ